jgi:hypothetical protein
MGILVSCCVTAIVCLFFFAMLAAVYGNAGNRGFWGGLAIGGWAYILLVCRPYDANLFGRHLLMTQAIEYAESLVPDQRPYAYDPYTEVGSPQWIREKIRAGGHGIFALVIGLATGVVVRKINLATAIRGRVPRSDSKCITDSQLLHGPHPADSRPRDCHEVGL